MYIRDEKEGLLCDPSQILGRWSRFFGTLLNANSVNLSLDMAAEVPQRPTAHTLGDEPMIEKGVTPQNSDYIMTRQSSGSSIRSSSGSGVEERYPKGGGTRSLRSCAIERPDRVRELSG